MTATSNNAPRACQGCQPDKHAWIAVHGDVDQAKRMIASLPSLPIGEAWFWNPATDLFALGKVRRRRTFDSGATPKAGQRKAVPKVLADVDLRRLGATIAAAAEEAKANDPKALRAKVAELERLLRAKPGAPPPAAPAKAIEKPVPKEAELKRIEASVHRAETIVDRLVVQFSEQLPKALAPIGEAMRAAARRIGRVLGVRGAVASVVILSARTGEVLPVCPEIRERWPWRVVRDEHGKPTAILIGGLLEAPLGTGRRDDA